MKKALFLVLALIWVAVVLGCGGTADEISQEPDPGLDEIAETVEGVIEEVAGNGQDIEYEHLHDEFVALIDYFRNQGLAVEDVYEVEYQDMIGSAHAAALRLEGGYLEFYLYDPDTAEEERIRELEEARSTGFFQDLEVSINGNLMLMHFEHPALEEVIDVFMRY